MLLREFQESASRQTLSSERRRYFPVSPKLCTPKIPNLAEFRKLPVKEVSNMELLFFSNGDTCYWSPAPNPFFIFLVTAPSFFLKGLLLPPSVSVVCVRLTPTLAPKMSLWFHPNEFECQISLDSAINSSLGKQGESEMQKHIDNVQSRARQRPWNSGLWDLAWDYRGKEGDYFPELLSGAHVRRNYLLLRGAACSKVKPGKESGDKK